MSIHHNPTTLICLLKSLGADYLSVISMDASSITYFDTPLPLLIEHRNITNN